MRAHEMLHVLQQIEERLPSMLHHPFTEWVGVDLDGESPRIERLWTQVEQFRVCLDRIHSSTTASMHRHHWPSAMHVVSGRLEMSVGSGSGSTPPIVAATVLLNECNRFEMIHPDGWHAIRSLNGPVMSVVVTAPAWDREHAEVPAKPLSSEGREAILRFFRERYRGLK